MAVARKLALGVSVTRTWLSFQGPGPHTSHYPKPRVSRVPGATPSCGFVLGRQQMESVGLLSPGGLSHVGNTELGVLSPRGGRCSPLRLGPPFGPQWGSPAGGAGGSLCWGSRSLGLASPSLIHPFTPSLIYSLSRCWPRPGFWDTTHRASCSNVLWSSCGPLTVAFEELCGLPHAPVPQGFPWSPLSSWASAVPTVRNAHQAHFPAHILPSPPGPASAVFQEALPHSQGGPPSLSLPLPLHTWLRPISDIAPLWPFTGHGWVAGAPSGCPLHPWPPSTGRAHMVSRMTEVPKRCCSHLSSGADQGFGPLTKTFPLHQA